MDGLNLIATWTEPFSLEAEEISYVISITKTATGITEEHTVNVTRFVFTAPAGPKSCQEYGISVFSKNDFSKSISGVFKKRNISTGNNRWLEIMNGPGSGMN